MPKGVTISKLSREMCRALGLSFSYVEGRARALQAAGLLPSGKSGHAEVNAAELDPEHGLLILLAVLSGKSGERAVEDVRTFTELRLMGVSHVKAGGGGVFYSSPLDPDAGDLLLGGEPFLLSLAKLMVAAFDGRPMVFDVQTICVGGALGSRCASIAMAPPTNPAAWIRFDFGLPANPLGQAPDDAPLCGLAEFRQVPGVILHLLVGLFSAEAMCRHAALIEASAEGPPPVGLMQATTHQKGTA